MYLCRNSQGRKKYKHFLNKNVEDLFEYPIVDQEEIEAYLKRLNTNELESILCDSNKAYTV